MPLNTEIVRDGAPMDLHWGGFHVAAMVFAAAWDEGEGPFVENTPPNVTGSIPEYPETPMPVSPRDAWNLVNYHVIAAVPTLNRGEHVVKNHHRFQDTTDGEILELMPGDVLKTWRD